MLLLLLQYLPPLYFSYRLFSNSKELLLLLVLLCSLPPLAVPLTWDLFTLHITLDFNFHFNCNDELMILLLLQSLPPLHVCYCLYSNYKEGLLLLVVLQ